MTPHAAFDLPRESYPFCIEFFSVRDAEASTVLHRIDVTGPGGIQIPPLAVEHGVPIWVRMTYPDGTTQEQWPPT